MQRVNVRGDSTRHWYTGFLWIWCLWSVHWFLQSLGVIHKIAVNSVLILLRFRGLFGFTKVPRGGDRKIVVNWVCVDLIKVQGVFCKIDIHKVRGLFCKIIIHWLQVNFTKVQGILCKIYVPNYSWPSDRPIRQPRNSGLRGHLLVQGNAPGLVIRYYPLNRKVYSKQGSCFLDPMFIIRSWMQLCLLFFPRFIKWWCTSSQFPACYFRNQ